MEFGWRRTRRRAGRFVYDCECLSISLCQVGELDNRGSNFYLALYWAEALAAQNDDADLKAEFTPIAQNMLEHEARIVEELIEVQGENIEIGGYYQPNDEMTSKAMRASATFNKIINEI